MRATELLQIRRLSKYLPHMKCFKHQFYVPRVCSLRMHTADCNPSHQSIANATLFVRWITVISCTASFALSYLNQSFLTGGVYAKSFSNSDCVIQKYCSNIVSEYSFQRLAIARCTVELLRFIPHPRSVPG